MSLPRALVEAREKYYANQDLVDMLVHWRYREQHPDSDREDFSLMREYFADMFGNAMARKNSALFRHVAEILDSLPEGDYEHVDREALVAGSDHNPVRFVIQARIFLEAQMLLERAPQRTLTKREVKLLAMRLWAINRLVAQGKLELSSSETSSAIEKMIQDEIENRLPHQDWTEVFDKAGCKDLKNAAAGRPPKKKKKS
jgi:hypothetical protein